ncbi:MAG: hypothetical protein WD294_02310 [Phycisphaeraceae bacterium]
MAAIVTLADAVVTQLNAATFDPTVTAERHYRPRVELGDVEDVRVTVVPKAIRTTAATRGAASHEGQIDIAIQQRLSDETAAAIDPLMDLVQQIADQLLHRRLDAMPQALCVRLTNEPIYAVDHLDELRTFTSVLTVTYRLRR